MATKEIEKVEPREVTRYEAPEGGWESDGNEDATPIFPVVKIVQATSGMEGAGKHAGEFHHSDWEDYTGTLDVVALTKRDTRALFEVGHDRPSCASPDNITPFPNQALWQQDAATLALGTVDVPDAGQPAFCAECPFGQWAEDGTPPPCKQSAVILIDRNPGGDEPDLAQLRIGGTSLKPWRNFVARKLAPKKLPMFTQELHLYTDEHRETGKAWYELRVDAKPLPMDVAHRYNDLLRAQRARFVAATEQEPPPESAPADVWPSDVPPKAGLAAGVTWDSGE